MESPSKHSIAELVQTCRDVVAGKIEFVEGVRAVHAHLSEMEDPYAKNEVFDGIRGLESELDGYPTGELRKQYVPSYLAELDASLARYQAQMQPVFVADCRHLIENYTPLLEPDTSSPL